ncbi:hypothetical protein C8P63_1269 [Melghirimyces profundicolus]|uniref:LPXTG-motif cell wall-anchored protein n=1 Tax=Melghirimyces profundicolus TaxID=1242148 RepID=A0A2T6BCD9_9BACL|nr:hypothetical protein [Melghirimyces profundicolus]PTX53723.1 hypothetical protein C8P63_1269 [Melghirimyces profundicolus]
MGNRIRRMTSAWLLIFLISLILTPFQAVAHDKEEDPDNVHYLEMTVEKPDETTVEIIGELKGGDSDAVSASGTWSFQLIKDGEPMGEAHRVPANGDADSLSAEASFNDLEPGVYKGEVHFSGTVVNLKGEETERHELTGVTDEIIIADPTAVHPGGITDGEDGEEPGPEGESPVGEDTDATGDKGDSNEESTEPLPIEVTVVPLDSEDAVQRTQVKGSLVVPEGVKVQGTWTFKATDKADGSTVDEKTESDVEGPEGTTQLDVTEAGEYVIEVSFEGSVDGGQVTGEGSFHYLLPEEPDAPYPGDEELKTGYSHKDGKHILQTTMLNAETAKGTWGIAFIHEKDIDHPDRAKGDYRPNHEGVMAEWEFDELKPGHYTGVAIFEGKADGEITALYEKFEFIVKEDGTITPGPDSGTPNHGGKLDPDEGKKAIADIIGGKMPDTAADQPTYMLYGGAATAAGLVLLGFVCRRKIFSPSGN